MSNKNIVSNKEKKRMEKESKKPGYRSPSKTTWGKIAIIIIVFAMVAAPIIYLIYYLISSLV